LTSLPAAPALAPGGELAGAADVAGAAGAAGAATDSDSARPTRLLRQATPSVA
jgi:hypothetical protein